MSVVNAQSAPDTGFGIDKLRLVYPSDARSITSLAHLTRSAVYGGVVQSVSDEHEHPNGWKVFVRHSRRAGTATVEFNPSRVMEPDGWRVWSVEHCHRAIAEVLDFINEEQIEYISAPAHVGRLMRVDVARDFDVSGKARPAQRFIPALTPLHRAYARRTQAFWHGDRWNGLVVGGDEQVSLYVKDRVTTRDPDPPVDESGLPMRRDMWAKPEKVRDPNGPEGLRFEVRGREEWLARAHLHAVEDLTHERVLAFALERWKWSLMGSTIDSPDQVLQTIAATGLLRDEQRASFAGWLAARQHGVTLPVQGRANLRLFEHVAAVIGVADDDLLSGRRAPKVSSRWTRLDFENGFARTPTLVRRRRTKRDRT